MPVRTTTLAAGTKRSRLWNPSKRASSSRESKLMPGFRTGVPRTNRLRRGEAPLFATGFAICSGCMISSSRRPSGGQAGQAHRQIASAGNRSTPRQSATRSTSQTSAGSVGARGDARLDHRRLHGPLLIARGNDRCPAHLVCAGKQALSSSCRYATARHPLRIETPMPARGDVPIVVESRAAVSRRIRENRVCRPSTPNPEGNPHKASYRRNDHAARAASTR